MNLLKLSFITKFNENWRARWFDFELATRNINLWEELEQPMKPGESFKEYRQRLDEVARKVHELRKQVRED